MSSNLPSGPKPTKEAYLTALRTLKEQHKCAEEDMKIMMSSPVKSMKGRPLFAMEEIVPCKEEKGASSSNQLKGKHRNRAGKKEVSINAVKPPLEVVPGAIPKPPKPQKVSNIVQSTKIVVNQKLDKTEHPSISKKEAKQVKLGKKANRRFTALAGMLPNLRMDKSLKLEVASTLMAMECWSDDEPDPNSLVESIDHNSNQDTDSDSDFGVVETPPPEAFQEPQFASVKLSAAAQSINDKTTETSAISVKKKGKPEKGKTVQHAYLEKQREEARRKAKEAIIQKAVKLYVKVRKKEAETSRKQHWATSGKQTVERLVRTKIINFRVNKILNQGFALAVERRIKMDRRDKRRMLKRIAAQRTIRNAWRKFRVRFLLGCVIEYIRLKARLFREQMEREEREFRMRTAMRRVTEDRQFKVWMEEQKVHPTFPMKESESIEEREEIAIALRSPRINHLKEASHSDTAKNQIPHPSPRVPQLSLYSKPHPPHSGFFITAAGDDSSSNSIVNINKHNKSNNKHCKNGSPDDKPVSSARSFDSTILSITAPSPRPVSHSAFAATAFSQATPLPSARSTYRTAEPAAPAEVQLSAQKQDKEFEFHRPDLAPFSTMINQMITSSMLFQSKKEKDWVDMATVGPDYATTFQQKKKSPAYSALEKLCGVSEADVIKSQMQSRKDGNKLKIKSFGHSIISL